MPAAMAGVDPGPFAVCWRVDAGHQWGIQWYAGRLRFIIFCSPESIGGLPWVFALASCGVTDMP